MTIYRLMKLNFKEWFLENWASPTDTFQAEIRPGSAIFKWVMNTVSQDDWDKEMHIHTLGDKAMDDPDVGPESGSGGKPVQSPGRWILHKTFKMDKSELENDKKKWDDYNDHDRNRYYEERMMDKVYDEAKDIVKREPDVYATMVMMVGPLKEREYQDQTKVLAYYIATSGNGKTKNISSILPRGRGREASDMGTQINNALWKQLKSFGFEEEQYKGFNIASSSLARDQTHHVDLFGMQYRSWRWQLVLTDEGWRAYERGMGRYMSASGAYKYPVSATVVYRNGWVVDDASCGGTSLSKFERDMASGKWGGYTNPAQREYATDKINKFDEEVEETSGKTHLAKIANPFLVPPGDWNQLVEAAIMMAIDDDIWASKT
jgi:hypothetical protein